MWLMTNEGFYSIVEKPWDQEDFTLTIRARRRDDIEVFLKMAREIITSDYHKDLDIIPLARPTHAVEDEEYVEGSEYIEHDLKSDYAWRIRLKRELVAVVLCRFVGRIHYDNFKNSVSAAGKHEHASCYSKVWSAMMGLQYKVRSWGAGAATVDPIGRQGHLHLGTQSRHTGGAVAAEMGYGEYSTPYDELHEGEFEAEEGDPTWLCPACDLPVDVEQCKITGQCNNCDSELDECPTCLEYITMGRHHECVNPFGFDSGQI
jgi:hypothetical protein